MAAAAHGEENSRRSRREVLRTQGRALVDALQAGDEAAVESAVLALSRSRRIFAPLVFAVGAFVMLFQGLRLVFVNWRLMLVQVLPAMWIWAAMLDLKVHAFRGKDFHAWSGPARALARRGDRARDGGELLPQRGVRVRHHAAGPAADPAGVCARATALRGRPRSRADRRRRAGVLGGRRSPLGTPVVRPLDGVVVGVMMLTYVTLPARIVGVRPAGSRRDKLGASLVGGALGALICTPPYLLGRLGILLLGSHVLFVLGIVLLAVGFTLQAGATGAVKAIKMSAKLAAGDLPSQSAEARTAV